MKNLLLALFIFSILLPTYSQTAIYDSGGKLMHEQAVYDVKYYDLTLSVFPDIQSIEGHCTMHAKMIQPSQWIVMDLDTLLIIKSIREKSNLGFNDLSYHRDIGKIWIQFEDTKRPGEIIIVDIQYGGKPRIAPRPPWQGGFQWTKTASGAPWIATSCQSQGADIWWPVKDHISDEPDSMRLHISVPEPLEVASNGRLENVESKANGISTFHWFISNPINVYNVALNIAPYSTIETDFKSVSGDVFPVIFYVLPEDYDKGLEVFPEFLDQLQFFETNFGPYPFRSDKYGIAQTPHLGMEHQSIIAYGANFNNAAMTLYDWGFDALHQHELAHEWWGNLITCADWKDTWIHEGFASYMQALYAEVKFGKEIYHRYMNSMRRFSNRLAVAPRESKTAEEIFRAPIYSKGAWFLHTLRYCMGDQVFFKALRKMCYPTPDWEKRTDGSQTRFVTTDDFLAICENESGMELDGLFEVYLRQPKLPILHSSIEKNHIRLSWELPVDVEFPVPVQIQLGNEIKKMQIPTDGITINFSEGIKPVVDPDNWILFDPGGN